MDSTRQYAHKPGDFASLKSTARENRRIAPVSPARGGSEDDRQNRPSSVRNCLVDPIIKGGDVDQIPPFFIVGSTRQLRTELGRF